jgi:hypothetical protein
MHTRDEEWRGLLAHQGLKGLKGGLFLIVGHLDVRSVRIVTGF